MQWDPDKPTELLGIGLAVFSSCGYFLASRADTMPAAIWIWSVKETRLHAVIVHKQPVTGVYLLCYNMYTSICCKVQKFCLYFLLFFAGCRGLADHSCSFDTESGVQSQSYNTAHRTDLSCTTLTCPQEALKLCQVSWLRTLIECGLYVVLPTIN